MRTKMPKKSVKSCECIERKITSKYYNSNLGAYAYVCSQMA
jgi:hypothetical protein